MRRTRSGWRSALPRSSNSIGAANARGNADARRRISIRPSSVTLTVLTHRPLRDKALRLVGLDLVPFAQHAAREFGIGVPERPRRRETVDHDQHLLHLRPVPVQRHRIAARGPGIAETDHAADIGEPQRRVDDRQREDDVLAGVLRAMLSQNDAGRNAARDHRTGNDLAFRQIRSRRHAATHDRPAKKTLPPQPAGLVDPFVDILARAEHEQQVGRPQRRLDQMPRIDRGDLGLRRRSRRRSSRQPACHRERRTAMPRSAALREVTFRVA